MTALNIKFDPIIYARNLRNAGVSLEQAEIQAQTIEQVIEDIIANQELVTKKDLAELKLELIKWMLGIGLSGILAIAGLLKFMIH